MLDGKSASAEFNKPHLKQNTFPNMFDTRLFNQF